MKKAIFLDRDGVLNNAIIKNGKPYPPANLAEVVIADDVLPALTDLASLGYLLIGATNQPDVARGSTLQSTVDAINQYLLQQLPLLEINVCYHDDVDACQCRKPAPGLLIEAAKRYDIDLNESIMIGDRWKDIAAGSAAGCKTIWLDRGYQEPKPNEVDYIATSMREAANWVSVLTTNVDRSDG